MTMQDAEDNQDDQKELDQEIDRDEDGVAVVEDPEIGEDEDAENTDDQDHEVVHEGRDSQPGKKKRKTWQDRVNRVNLKVDAAQQARDEATRQLQDSQDEVTRLKSQIEVNAQQMAPKKPDPDDFDEGAYDPKYIEQKDAYDDHIIDIKVEKRMAKLTETNSTATNQMQTTQRVETKRREHYQRADELKASDFGDIEDKAIEVMGQSVVDDIIENIPKSERLVYFLGKNPEEAARIAADMKTNPALAVFNLGKLSSKLTVRPKSRSAPNPDDPLPGSGVPRKQKRGPRGATYN